MNEIKCPKCGEVFQVSEADYASIANQVKNQEFQKELDKRISLLHEQSKLEQENISIKQAREYEQALIAKQDEITAKQNRIVALEATISEFEKNKKLELEAEILKKDQEIQKLNGVISQHTQSTEVALLKQKEQFNADIRTKEQEISTLKNNISQAASEAALREKGIKEQYELRLTTAKEEIERIKDFKSKLSTKMIGESLEQHCSSEFNKVRMAMYPNAYFEKDNDASSGTKGDFIFRDYIGEQEYISIMFEMKNEADETATKHKNEDFFAKLDKDRNEKKCEYAVLVSMLEPESELYNEGIVDVSYRYPKMFVVRPQFFMTLIALLSQASRKSVDIIRELEVARSQHVDVTNFEAKVLKFRDAFGNNVRLAVKNHDDAISKIDATIKTLQGIKEMFEKSNKYLELADRKLEEDFTVRKLTHGNPTMKAMFDEARKLEVSSQGQAD